jgi:hypothetical protein
VLRSPLVAVVALSSLIVSACGPAAIETSQGPNFIPPETPHAPPWGLDTVDRPVEREALVAAFSRLPRQILGVPFVEHASTCLLCSSPCVSSRDQACYEDEEGNLSFVRATRAREIHWVRPRVETVGAFFRQVVPSHFRHGAGHLEDFDPDPDDGLLWVASGADPRYGWYRFYWGDRDSEWVFEAWSGSGRMREAIVKAFVYTLRAPDQRARSAM